MIERPAPNENFGSYPIAPNEILLVSDREGRAVQLAVRDGRLLRIHAGQIEFLPRHRKVDLSVFAPSLDVMASVNPSGGIDLICNSAFSRYNSNIRLMFHAEEELIDSAMDEDFVPAIKKAQKLGKKVINAYFKSSSSTTLKKTCDDHIYMNDLIKENKNCLVLP